MDEDSQIIFEYLPIRRNAIEDDYIAHLWQVFMTLDEGGENSRSFSIMPYHLLFMLAIQYKVMRLTTFHERSMNLFFSAAGGRNKEKLLSLNRSVFDIAYINERTLPEFLQLIDADPSVIKDCKKLISNRNENLAHAKGSIESDPDKKIVDYLTILREVQKCYNDINTQIAQAWSEEVQEDDDMDQFFENRFLNSYICPRDFGDILQYLLLLKGLDNDQWQQLANKGIELSKNQTVSVMKSIADGQYSTNKKAYASKTLEDYAYALD